MAKRRGRECVRGLAPAARIGVGWCRQVRAPALQFYIGQTNPPTPLEEVTFDGCIYVRDESGSGNDGDLNGYITVVGCHATDDDLCICVDGSVGQGAITITQTGCTEQVTHSCP